MTPKIIIPPDDEPISIEEARAHLEAQPYFDSDVDPVDDAMIEGWIGAAREYCENFLGLSLSLRVLEIALDSFPVIHSGRHSVGLGVDLPMGPAREILSISWGDESDDEMAAVDFVLDDYSRPHRVRPVAFNWPSVPAAPNAIKVRYLAGYGADSDGGEPLPKAIRAAMLLILGHLYENRSETNEGQVFAIPIGAEAFLRPLRVRLGMA